ncbi:metallophosphoesterase [Roseivirga sp. BDSF3-8]|uniref:metallophosphoesterase n=1 Tax=Roseivirga sp. BDSF3-8 TaxID=3241598 RepID=UPI0035319C8C
MSRGLWIALVVAFLILIDIYVFQAVRVMAESWSLMGRRIAYSVYWGLSILAVLGIFAAIVVDFEKYRLLRYFIFSGIFANILGKVFASLFLGVDDIMRGVQWVWQQFSPPAAPRDNSRHDFLVKGSIIAGTIPLVTMSYGIISGAHDYRVITRRIALPNLPKSFHGIRIAQVSDIHSGSFFNKTAVKGGVEMVLNEKPDLIFFTGDLVNNESKEVRDYIPVFNKLKAPLGVYSTLGNHDYANYTEWPSEQARVQDVKNLMEAHRIMGYDLLMNEHRMLEQGGDKLAILGVENWGKGRFPKYGRLDQAHKGTGGAAVKLLLSHDPSHWDGQVRPEYPDIDVMFAGHTHGFQFGVEIGDFRWSPSQYVYKQWADLYKEGNQYLYVNRGFGFLGFPGRVGMPPEITIIELVTA